MRKKAAVWGFVGLLALLIGVVFVGCGESGGTEDASSAAPAAKAETGTVSDVTSPDSNVDIVYYFMTTQRCPSCVKIETFTRETVQAKFAEELKKGSMTWRIVNVDLAGNEHFIKDFGLYTKSVVLVKIRDGKRTEWKNLDRVWELLGDETAFRTYIADEVKQFVEKA